MRKAYYIESKTFITDVNGNNIMAADLGQMPMIATSLKKGEIHYHRLIAFNNKLLGYETEKVYTLEEIGVGNCMARAELHNKEIGNKKIISLYQIWI